MAVDDDFIDPDLELLLIVMIMAFWFWALNRCLGRLCRPPRSRSFTDHTLHPPAAPTRSPLHPSLFVLLPTSTYSSATAGADEHSQAPRECAICLDEFKERDIGRVLPNCHHFFHLYCIDNWLRRNKTCPLCREVVMPPPQSTGEGQLENSSNVNLPPPIWCPRNTRHQAIESEQVVIEIPEEDNLRSHRQSTSLRELARLSIA